MMQKFIGIGAQKCASSWLHEILADHPEVAVAAVKEVDYFTHRFENGHRWYDGQFMLSPGVQARGEISPSYFHEPSAANRAFAYEPRFLVIVSLRDPVERALSQHRHLARLGLLPANDLSFETALATNPTYVDQGLYFRHLSHWRGVFGAGRIHVVVMEDIQANAAGEAVRLYQFLGVSDTHRSRALGVRSNESYVARSRGMEQSVRTIRSAVSRLGLRSAWTALGDTGLRSLYRRVNRQSSGNVLPAPRPETLAALRETFRPDVERLQVMLDRDLSTWIHPTPP